MNLFQKEFTLGIELEHPNIVRYFDYGEDEKGPFIKMDYVDGEDLELFAAKHPDFFNSKQNRQQLLNELLDALAYLHGKQMLHLDLKPGNILITNKGHHVKLIDLGFGWAEGFLQEGGFSRDYCAPEQLSHQAKNISAATDIYALGKIMQRFLRPKLWPFVLLAAIILGAFGWMLSTTVKSSETVPVPHDTLYTKQIDTVFIPEPKPELTLEDSLALFKEELKNALAPTFGYWYMMIDNMFENQPDLPKEMYLEYSKFYIDKGVDISRGIIKEKLNTMHLSKASRPAFEKVGQEVINYYLRDYRKLKKKLEAEQYSG